MADLNSVIIVGRLTRDAKLTFTATGKAVSNFSVAVNEKRKNGEKWVNRADFFDVTLWGSPAESLQQYLTKGKQVGIHGKLSQERWEQDEHTRSKVVIIAKAIQLLGGASGDEEDFASKQGPPDSAATDATFDDDDVPF